MKKIRTALIAVCVACSLFTACGADTSAEPSDAPYLGITERAAAPSAGAAYDYAPENALAQEEYELPAEEWYDEDVMDMADAGDVVAGGEATLPITAPSIETSDRKIVYTVDLSLQTTEFEEGVKQIPEMVEAVGGFVQDSYVQGSNINDRYYSRSASFTVRVPVETLNAFTEDLGGIFHVVSQQKSSSDISNSYYDTQARLDSLRIQEERLKAMLETADELQYLLEVERELAQVLYEIESMTSSLRRMDSSVNLSTITIHLQEVSIIDDALPEPKPVTFRDRAGEAFGDSVSGFIAFCQGVLLFLIALVPFLPIFAVIALVVWLIVRSARKRAAKRAELRRTAYPAQIPYQPQTPPSANPPAPGNASQPEPPRKDDQQ